MSRSVISYCMIKKEKKSDHLNRKHMDMTIKYCKDSTV